VSERLFDIVTNEGNGYLTQILPRRHLVIRFDEKIVADADGRLHDPAAAGARGRPARTFGSTRPSRRPPAPPMTIPTARKSITWYPRQLSTGVYAPISGDAARHPLRRCVEPCRSVSCVRRHASRPATIRANGTGARAVYCPWAGDRRREAARRCSYLHCGLCESVCPMDDPAAESMLPGGKSVFERGLTPFDAAAGLRFWAYFRRSETSIARDPCLRCGRSDLGRAACPLRPALPLAAAGQSTATCPRPSGRTFMTFNKALARA